MSKAPVYPAPYDLRRLFWPLALGLIALAYVHGPYGGELFYPRHSWAQADRLALAMQFYDEGMDLFHPRTYNIDPEDRVTGVEFPIQSYLAAALGHVFGRTSIPTCFRLLTSLAVLFGLVCLFRMVDERIRNIGLSLIPPAFLLSSPTIQHYTWSYLPDAFGFGLFLGALYFGSRMLWQASLRNALWAVGLGCGAALAKMSVAFYLPFLCIYLFLLLPGKKARVNLILASLAGAVCLAGWFWYMQHLNKVSGSGLFLAEPRPLGSSYRPELSYPGSIRWELRDIFGWHGREFLTTVGYGAFFVFAILGLGGILSKARQKSGEIGFMVSAGAGAVIGNLVMGSQLIVHDYYAIVLWFPLASLMVASGVIALSEILSRMRLPYVAKAILSLALILILLWPTQRIHLEQTRGKDRSLMAWLLDAKDIPFALFSPESKALFPTEEAPNLGQVYFDVLGKSKQMAPKGAEGLIQILQEAQAFSLDHAVLPKAVATEMLESLPCMPTWIASIHQGNTFTILTFKNLDQLGGTWMSAGTHQRTLVFPKDSCLDLPSFTEHLGSYSEVVSPSRGFGINFNNPASTFSGADSLFISLEAQTSDSARTKCLCIWEKPGQHTIIGSIDLNSAGPDFTPFTLKVPLSDSIPPRQRINCFVMNKSERDTLFVRSARARWE